MSITATIFKFDPTVDAEPHYDTYDVPWHEGMSLLELVRYVHDTIEPLSFDYNCRGGSCGLCSMKVNGTPKLACLTILQDGEELTVEPLDRFPVVKDLIEIEGYPYSFIDHARYFAQMKEDARAKGLESEAEEVMRPLGEAELYLP